VEYTDMAPFYDDIMRLGRYYDYAAVAANLAAVTAARRALELGVGTGLVLQQLLERRPDYDVVDGVDLTAAMLEIARKRLQPWFQVGLEEQDVTGLDLPGRVYDLAWSYGGPWYWVPDGGTWAMVSHIRPDEDNARGLARVAAHLAPGGLLLLGVQGPHSAYERPLGDGRTYAQRLDGLDGGFRKEYWLTDDATGQTLMRQVIDYRLYSFPAALAMLAACGLRQMPSRGPMFLEFALS